MVFAVPLPPARILDMTVARILDSLLPAAPTACAMVLGIVGLCRKEGPRAVRRPAIKAFFRVGLATDSVFVWKTVLLPATRTSVMETGVEAGAAKRWIALWGLYALRSEFAS